MIRQIFPSPCPLPQGERVFIFSLPQGERVFIFSLPQGERVFHLFVTLCILLLLPYNETEKLKSSLSPRGFG